MATTGIVGLGLIGMALSRRLINDGVTPVVFDLKVEALQAAVADGAAAASSSRDLAARCEIILVAVQNDKQCVTAIAGPDGLLEGTRPGTCIAVISTVMPSTIISLAKEAAAKGVDLVDTPMAGRGMFSVQEGSMTVMVGDQGQLVEKLKPILGHFASRIVPAGKLGGGAALKLTHNMVVYAGFAALVEAVKLADAAGVGAGLLEEVATSSGALSSLSAMYMQAYKHFRDNPHTVEENDALRVAASLLDKDLGDAVALADSLNLDTPVARLLSHSGTTVFPVGS